MIIIEVCPKCGHDLYDTMICTNPPIPRKECLHCGWVWEGKQEEIVRVPFYDGHEYEFGKRINGAEESILSQEDLKEIQRRLEEFVQINSNTYEIVKPFNKTACLSCPSNPKNGGDGICFCTLGQLQITC